MTIDDLATQFVNDLSFDALLNWCYTLGIKHEDWLDDEWSDREDELRVAVAEAMANLGRAK